MFSIGIPLIDAASSGDLAEVERLVTAGTDLEVRDQGGRTPLIAAVGYCSDSTSSIAIANLLLDAGAGIDVADDYGRTAMYFAAKEAEVDMVRLLRARGVRIADNISLPDFVHGWPRRVDSFGNDSSCYQQVFDWMLEEKPLLDAVNNHGQSALFIACSENITDVALRLIELGADVNIQNGSGWCALTLASHRRNLEVVEALLKAGADVDVPDRSDGRTALAWACSEKHSEAVARALIKSGADIDHADKYGETPLMRAIPYKQMDTLSLLLQSGAKVNLQDHEGKTALAHAARWRDEAVVALLLEHDADASIADHAGRLPADIAAGEWFADVVERLGNAKPRESWSSLAQAIFDNDFEAFKIEMRYPGIDLAEADGRTPLHIAIYEHRTDMVELLLTLGSDATASHVNMASPLHIAVEQGYVDMAEVLLKCGAKVDCVDSNGETPLYRAVAQSNGELTKLLLDYKADTNLADKDQKTALMIAAKLGQHAIVEQLIAAGADVNRTDRYKRSALFAVAACKKDSASVTQLLIEAGADVDAIADVLGEINVLQQAAINGHTEMVKLLIEAGVDLNWCDPYAFDENQRSGQTPLYKAVCKGHEAIFNMLMDAGADFTITTPKGESLLHLAAKEGHLSIAEQLIKAGLDIDARDSEGNTPLKSVVAFGKKKTELLALLIKHHADPDIAGTRGWTPLHNACWLGYQDIAEQLLSAGARLDIPDSDGKTAYQLAKEQAESRDARQGHKAILALLAAQ